MTFDIRPVIAFQKALDVFVTECRSMGLTEVAAGTAEAAQKQVPPPAPLTLDDDTAKVLAPLYDRGQHAIGDVSKVTGFPVHKVRALFAKLVEAGVIKRTGEKRGTRYEIVAPANPEADAPPPLPPPPPPAQPVARPASPPEGAAEPPDGLEEQLRASVEEAPPSSTRKKKKAGKKVAPSLDNDTIEAITAELQIDDGVLLEAIAEATEIPAKHLGKYLAELVERGIVDASDPDEDEEGEVFYYLAAGK